MHDPRAPAGFHGAGRRRDTTPMRLIAEKLDRPEWRDYVSYPCLRRARGVTGLDLLPAPGVKAGLEDRRLQYENGLAAVIFNLESGPVSKTYGRLPCARPYAKWACELTPEE